ncbi:MAG: PAS domain S-box protein [Bacteroidales bacterium]|nr:PAS domain S-box protein [Bacteroidales bacterium]
MKLKEKIDILQKEIASIKRSEEKFRLMAETAKEMILTYKMNGEVTYCNDFALEVTGYKRENLDEINIYDIISPEFLEEVYQRRDKRLGGDFSNFHFEITIKRKNESTLYLDTITSAILKDGKFVEMLVVARDISEKKKVELDLKCSEQKYHELFDMIRSMSDAVPDMIWAKDLDGNFTFTNKTICEKLLNAKDTNEPIGKHTMFFVNRERETHKDEKDWFTFGEECTYSDSIVIKNKQSQRFDEHGNVFGKFLYLDVFKAPLFNDKGKLIGTVGSARDVTKQKLDAKILKESEIHLRELNATKDKFFNIIGHDLRSPFNTISGFAELLSTQFNEFNNDEKKAMAEAIYKTSNNTLKLIDNLLFWSRSQNNSIKFEPEKFHLKVLVNNLLVLFKDVAAKKKINISAKIPVPITVFCDENMINIVLRNLTSNAIKFTSKNGNVLITAKKENGNIKISIKDDGVGIEPEDINKLFKIDESVSTLGTDNESGTGLGLILCKEFVEKNGGKISVISKVGKGSTFSFTLPTA